MRIRSETRYLRMFSNKVRLRRLEMRITQEKLAELTDCHVNHVGRIERAQADPSLSMIFRIAKSLDITPKDLMP